MIDKSNPAYLVYPDGRTICRNAGKYLTAAGRALYRRLTEWMWRRQNKRCCLCRRPLSLEDASFEHEVPRGAGGGSRDDRIYVRDMRGRLTRNNGASHVWCNAERGSRRTELWQPRYRKEV